MAEASTLIPGFSNATERYPWHDPIWSTLERQIDRLPHALLLHGRPGLGKHSFALQLAQALLCIKPQVGVACGQCRGCQLYAGGTHPDLFYVGQRDDAQSITIDQIRELGNFLSLRPHTASRKIVIISPAEAMNLNAANSLLKLLEEPPLGSMLFLVSSYPVRLPATIRSRCSHVLFRSPARATGLAWLRARSSGNPQLENLLEFAGGAPLLAESLIQDNYPENRSILLQDLEKLRLGNEDPMLCAARWKRLGLKLCLGWLAGFVGDLIKLQLGAPATSLSNPEVVTRFNDVKYKLIINKLYNFTDIIHEYYRHIGGPLDELLILEDVLIHWVRLSRLQ